jgi:hypothetical protein
MSPDSARMQLAYDLPIARRVRARYPLAAVLFALACDDAGLSRLKSKLEVDPEEIDLGTVELGRDAYWTIALASTGERAVTIETIALDGDQSAFSLDGRPRALEPRQTMELRVRFAPQTTGTYEATVSIESDADDGAMLSVAIHAIAIDPCIDRDGDHYGDGCTAGADCDDGDPEVHPGALELCNGRDENCDRLEDDGFDVGARCTQDFSMSDGTTCTREGTRACDSTGARTSCVLSAVTELCDGADNDCNGTKDDPFTDLAQPCEVPDGACRRPGAIACAAGGLSTECRADASAQPICCADGMLENASGVCCAPLPAGACAYTCTIDVAAGTHDCAAPVTIIALGGGNAVAQIDMSGRASLEVRVDACSPSGHWLDVTDSPTCNGYGGDGNSSSNDAEVHLDGTQLAIYANDFVAPPASSPLFAMPFSPSGCGEHVFSFADRRVQTFDPCVDVTSDYALRLNPPADMEGTPDALWYVGLNRVVSDDFSRVGAGVGAATLCIR